jgi:hypothetical protein
MDLSPAHHHAMPCWRIPTRPRNTTDMSTGPSSARATSATAASQSPLSSRPRRPPTVQLSKRNFARRAMNGSRVCTAPPLRAQHPSLHHYHRSRTWAQTMPQRAIHHQTSPLARARPPLPTSVRTRSRPSTTTRSRPPSATSPAPSRS